MEQKLKQRLVGAAVIISLLVIFLPVIFDGSGYNQFPRINIDTPAQPHLDIEQDFTDLSTMDKQDIKKIYSEINLNGVNDKPTVQSKTPQQKEQNSAWKIQLGVFKEESNAKNLVSRLINKNYPAQYKSMRGSKGIYYVVEVISTSKKEINRHLKTLERDMKLKDLSIKKQS